MVVVGSIVLLAGHLICMNIAAAGPLLCLPMLRRGKRDVYPHATQVASQLALWSVVLLLAGIISGVALGLLTWSTGDHAFARTLPLFGKKIFWGVLEIICSLAWMLGYWFWLHRRPPQSLIARIMHGCLAVLSATNLLYHFPPLLTVMTQVASGEISVAGELDAKAFRELMLTPNVIAHSLHFWLASVAVSGGFLLWLVRKLERPEPYFLLGGRIALGATVLQIPAGLWLLLASPPAPQARLLGGHAIATSLFVASLFCVLLLLHYLAAISIGAAKRRHARNGALLMLATVVLMTGALHYLRG